jgi:Transposase domain (DUF772)
MAHIAGFGRDQLLLLPEAVDDYVEADNSMRFIDVFVDGLDLAAAGFGRVEAKATGRPGDAPGDLLKLYIYGYLNRVRSSRRLERECRRNVEVIWLLGALKPVAHAEGAFEGPHARHQRFEGDEAHGWRSSPQSWYPRRRSRPPPVRFSVFRLLLHSSNLPLSQPVPSGEWF